MWLPWKLQDPWAMAYHTEMFTDKLEGKAEFIAEILFESIQAFMFLRASKHSLFPQLWLGLIDQWTIHILYFPIPHNALCLPPKFCINYCCETLQRGLHVPKGISQQ